MRIRDKELEIGQVYIDDVGDELKIEHILPEHFDYFVLTSRKNKFSGTYSLEMIERDNWRLKAAEPEKITLWHPIRLRGMGYYDMRVGTPDKKQAIEFAEANGYTHITSTTIELEEV